MVKKASHIILTMLLLISTIGLAVSKHYCGGELISTAIFTEAESCCDSDNCCNNQTEVFQFDEDYFVSVNQEIPETSQLDLLAIAVVVFNLHITTSLIATTQEFVVRDAPPPPKIQVALAQRQSYLL
ncbi:hypothetical protein EYV94_13015 [Puteibacter caeruleilacunae]|nr:hypothetical protein EYV94_13015 [Puteibacter caeruleilacunae]